jgi:hypothetical protein
VRPVAQQSFFNLIHPARTNEDIAKNKEEVATSLPRLFHYRVSGIWCPPTLQPNSQRKQSRNPPTDPYGNPEIARALAVALFHSVLAIRALHRKLFGPLMPLQAVTFILVNVSKIDQTCTFSNYSFYLQLQVSGMEFSTGSYSPIKLNVAQQFEMYVEHASGLAAYEEIAPRRMREMQREWYRYAM